MPKVSLDMPLELKIDLEQHVGDDGKFVSLADAIRTACRKCWTIWMMWTCVPGGEEAMRDGLPR